ncbi:MAG: 4-alpha-glucanotransferase [Clostridiales bacterium]|nr:4-alpha-glucanotransferase [Clostridiales bacterium]
MKQKRKSGVLLPLTALPTRYGIGGFGREAREFARMLADSGQSVWQILPLGITDFVHSPYASPSAFAGNPLLCDAEWLYERGLITRGELDEHRHEPFKVCDYEYAAKVKGKLLRSAFARFRLLPESAGYRTFILREGYWLDEFALFDMLKERFGRLPYWRWDEDIRLHRACAVKKCMKLFADEIEFRRFTQYIFDCQNRELRAYLDELGISLLGDIPFYVARDSADVWSHPELFSLDDDRTPKLVAGVPPDFFSEDGQLWGNPTYRWRELRDSGYKWWIKRLERCQRMYDITRLDHFRAFDSYYAIPAKAKTAKCGRWKHGPGRDFFDCLYSKLPEIKLIAEDLGDIGKSVVKLREYARLNGMKVMQFAFDGSDNEFLPHNYERNSVVYLGTHDNDTTAGWIHGLDDSSRRAVCDYLDIDVDSRDEEIVRRMMMAASMSSAELCIFSLQDLRCESSEMRINTPSKVGGCWMYNAGEINTETFHYLKQITMLYGRYPLNGRKLKKGKKL